MVQELLGRRQTRLSAANHQDMRIVIAEDHPLTRAGIRILFERDNGEHVIHEASSPEVLNAVLRTVDADLLITDYSMPLGQEPDGLEMLRRVHADYPELPIVVITMNYQLASIPTLLDSGARAVVDKAAPPGELGDACRAALSGEKHVSHSFMERMREIVPKAARGVTPSLSAREIEVIRLIARGLTVSEIAELTHRSVKTVSSQKITAMKKLGAGSDLDLYKYIHQSGWAQKISQEV